jgi:hypothetical protein
MMICDDRLKPTRPLTRLRLRIINFALMYTDAGQHYSSLYRGGGTGSA